MASVFTQERKQLLKEGYQLKEGKINNFHASNKVKLNNRNLKKNKSLFELWACNKIILFSTVLCSTWGHKSFRWVVELNNGKLPRQKEWLVNGKWPKESIKFYEPELGVVKGRKI